MPRRKRPGNETPKVEDESTGDPSERQGKQRERDEGLGEKGSTKGGMNRAAGGGIQGRQQNRSTLGRLQNRSTLRPDREAAEFRRSRRESGEPGGELDDETREAAETSPEEAAHDRRTAGFDEAEKRLRRVK